MQIIPYQELSGNYNCLLLPSADFIIIPYQELSGNYNVIYEADGLMRLYHTKNCQIIIIMKFVHI